ncbi:MAG: hypothetical protein K2V38_09675 [Gemmataceae bacterium]|nr:hypothetical protein [Gemmataceae bacterium]
MTLPKPVVILRHGTTLRRAERLLAVPPDAGFVEPGGNQFTTADGFSTVIAGRAEGGLGSAERYARAKAANFPSEGGPAILEVEVSAEIVDILRNDPIAGMIVASGEVRFEPDLGLPELQQVWPTLTKRVVPL